jgi:hypothetical protein
MFLVYFQPKGWVICMLDIALGLYFSIKKGINGALREFAGFINFSRQEHRLK